MHVYIVFAHFGDSGWKMYPSSSAQWSQTYLKHYPYIPMWCLGDKKRIYLICTSWFYTQTHYRHFNDTFAASCPVVVNCHGQTVFPYNCCVSSQFQWQDHLPETTWICVQFSGSSRFSYLPWGLQGRREARRACQATLSRAVIARCASRRVCKSPLSSRLLWKWNKSNGEDESKRFQGATLNANEDKRRADLNRRCRLRRWQTRHISVKPCPCPHFQWRRFIGEDVFQGLSPPLLWIFFILGGLQPNLPVNKLMQSETY